MNQIVYIHKNESMPEYIKIGDKVNNLSTFAMELLGYQRRSQGTLYFEYEDEILDDRRRRMDSENTYE